LSLRRRADGGPARDDWALRAERALVRAVSISLAVLVGVQILLANPSVRPYLNYAHRAEGIRLDHLPAVIQADGSRTATARPSGTVTLRLDGASAAAGVVRVNGVESVTVTALPVSIRVRDGDVVVVELGDGARTDGGVVTVVATGGNVTYPRVGSAFRFDGRVARLGPIVVRR